MRTWLGSLGRRHEAIGERAELPFGLTVVLAAVVGALTVVAAAGAGAASVGDPLQQVRGATVRIEASGCGGARTATGVRLADGRILTNRHAVVGDEVRVDGKVAPDVEVAEGADLAIVGAPEPGVGIRLAETSASPGDEVWMSSTRDGALTVTRARISSTVAGTGPNDPPWAWRLDVSVVPGDSGSPVVDGDGRLVGLVYAAEYGSTAALVVPVAFLDGPTVTPGPCT